MYVGHAIKLLPVLWLSKSLHNEIHIVMSKTGPPSLGRPYRLVVVGDCNVGKTALIEHFVYGNHVVGKVRPWVRTVLGT